MCVADLSFIIFFCEFTAELKSLYTVLLLSMYYFKELPVKFRGKYIV